MRSNFDPKILESTIKYDVSITSKSIFMNNLVDYLAKISLVDKPNTKKSSKAALKRHFLNLLSNLFNCYKSDKHFIAYPRASNPENKMFFPTYSPYNPGKITIYHLKKIISSLSENGFIESETGFRNRDIKYGKLSRMRATDKLIELFDEYKITRKHIIDHQNNPVLVLKNAEKEKITYYIDDNIKPMIDDIHMYNELLSKTEIRLLGEEIASPISKRTFNNSSFTEGGRLYGGLWQCYNSVYRKSMTINGHSTTELDYSCHHLRMLYNKEHMKTKDDLYEIGNYPRSHVKQSVNIALNSTSRRKAKLAILKALRDNDTSIQKEYVEKLFQAVFQKHFAISKYFFIGCGMGLQFHDSCIAMDIINQFTRNGQIVLSVHDSFICESSNEEKLWQLMTACYEKRFQFPPVIKKK